MQIEINIYNSDTPSHCYLNQDNVLVFFFSSLEDLAHFLEKKEKINLDKDENQENYIFLKQKEKEFNQKIKMIKEQMKKENIDVYVKDKNLIIPELLKNNHITYNLSYLPLKDVLYFLEKIESRPNFLFLDKYNSIKPRNKEELLATYQIMITARNFINAYDLSPAEKVFMAFDMCRQRKAIEALNERSRDLYEVLHHEEIVCAGYANMFACLCELLDINNEKLFWVTTENKDEPGHESNIVYLNDAKYNIHGIYAFDVTWNHIENDASIYQNRCDCSFVPLKIEKKKKEKNFLKLEFESSLYVALISRFERYQKLIKMKAVEKIITREMELIKNSLLQIYDLIGDPIDLENSSDLNELIFLFNHLEYTIISEDKLRKIFQTVRDIEVTINPLVYPNDENSINSLVESTYSYRSKENVNYLLQRIYKLKK